MSAALLLMAAGGLAQVYGQLRAGDAENQAAEMNAEIAGQNAELALQKAEEDERKLRVQGMKTLGDIVVGYGASGVTSQGSAADVFRASFVSLERDAQSIKRQGDLQAMNYRNEATLSLYRGRQAITASRIGAVGSLLGVGGNIAGKMPSGGGSSNKTSWNTPSREG